LGTFRNFRGKIKGKPETEKEGGKVGGLKNQNESVICVTNDKVQKKGGKHETLREATYQKEKRESLVNSDRKSGVGKKKEKVIVNIGHRDLF